MIWATGAPYAHPPRPGRCGDSSTGFTRRASTRSVLLADSHEDSLEICGAILRYHGYRTLEARDGAAALDLALTERPDLIVLDPMLPVVDGWSVIRHVREAEMPQTPIVAYTSLAFHADREQGLRMGLAAYLVKPCAPSTLLDVVRSLIGPAASPAV